MVETWEHLQGINNVSTQQEFPPTKGFFIAWPCLGSELPSKLLPWHRAPALDVARFIQPRCNEVLKPSTHGPGLAGHPHPSVASTEMYYHTLLAGNSVQTVPAEPRASFALPLFSPMHPDWALLVAGIY